MVKSPPPPTFGDGSMPMSRGIAQMGVQEAKAGKLWGISKNSAGNILEENQERNDLGKNRVI